MVIITGLVIFNYPDPYTQLLPQVKHRLLAQTVLISNGSSFENNSIFLVEGVQVRLDLVTSGGLRNVLRAETNSSGLVEVELSSGYYRITFADWWSGYSLINQPTVINVTKHLVDKQPSSIDIFSLSKNWTISHGNVIDTSFKNTLGQIVRIESVNIGEHTLSKKA